MVNQIATLLATAFLRHRRRMLEKSTAVEEAGGGLEPVVIQRPAVDVAQNGVKA